MQAIDTILTVFKENVELIYTEDGSAPTVAKRESDPIIKAVVGYLKENYAGQVKKLEEHFDMTLSKFIKEKTCPFSILQMAEGIFSVDRFFECCLAHDKEDRIIIDFLPVEEFLPAVDTMYTTFKEYEGSSVSFTVPEGTDISLPKLKPEEVAVVNSILGAYKVSPYEVLGGYIQEASKATEVLQQEKKAHTTTKRNATRLENQLREAIAKLTDELMTKPYAEAVATATGEYPEGKVVMKPAKEVFGESFPYNMSVPTWEWDGAHPLVPAKNPDYIFRPELLVRILYAITNNERAYLQGHTGSGKTTLLEQVAAALNYPFMRINFDSEITRMDLIGRETLITTDEGKTETKFIDGMLPTMMNTPCIACFDEIDFCRPDVAYVMQSALEGNGLRITEDGGRLVQPHPQFRMFATGNTKGQGDEFGMYQGARPQSLAFLDRFTVWLEVNYLTNKERENLLVSKVSTLTLDTIQKINKYTEEHLDGFLNGRVLQPISPRGMIGIANMTKFLESARPGHTDNVKDAITSVIIDRASNTDRPTLVGIAQRVLG